MAHVRRAGPPPASRDYVPVWRIKGTKAHTFIILSPAVWAYITHWLGNRTVPCTSIDHDVCNCPYKSHPQKWMGYLKAMEIGGKTGFVELTPGTANKIVASLDEGTPLRGYAFKFWRSSEGKGARHLVELVPHITRTPAQLEEDSDPETLLLKLWNAPNRRTM